MIKLSFISALLININTNRNVDAAHKFIIMRERLYCFYFQTSKRLSWPFSYWIAIQFDYVPYCEGKTWIDQANLCVIPLYHWNEKEQQFNEVEFVI